MYQPRYNTPEPNQAHDELDLCCRTCGCPGVGLSYLVGGVEAVRAVLATVDSLPRPNHGPVGCHIRAAERVIEVAAVVSRETFAGVDYASNPEDQLPGGIEPDSTVAALQHPLRILAANLREALVQPDDADERHVARDVRRILCAALGYAINLDLLGALGRLDLDWDLA